MRYRRSWKPKRWGLALVAGTVVVGCAHVSADELQSELDGLRAEIRESQEESERRLQDEVREAENRLDQRLSSLEQEFLVLQREFDDFQSTVERLESAIRFNSPVHFAFDEARVREEDHEILDRFAEVVRGYYQDALITVEGFTDSAGSAEYNLQLGEQRAQAVVDYLVDAGIPSDRLRAVSYGESSDRQVNPGAHGPGDAGWENRRVAMVVDFGARPSGVLTAEGEEGSESR